MPLTEREYQQLRAAIVAMTSPARTHHTPMIRVGSGVVEEIEKTDLEKQLDGQLVFKLSVLYIISQFRGE